MIIEGVLENLGHDIRPAYRKERPTQPNKETREHLRRNARMINEDQAFAGGQAQTIGDIVEVWIV